MWQQGVLTGNSYLAGVRARLCGAGARRGSHTTTNVGLTWAGGRWPENFPQNPSRSEHKQWLNIILT